MIDFTNTFCNIMDWLCCVAALIACWTALSDGAHQS